MTPDSILRRALIPIISPIRDSSGEHGLSFQRTMRRLAQLFVGSRISNEEIALPQGSFLIVLSEPHISPFFPNQQSHKEMAISCLRIMAKELRFNMFQFPSSFVTNKSVKNLPSLAGATVSPHLRLACRIWTYHVSQLDNLRGTIAQMISDFFRSHFLYWLEVMSVTQCSIF